MAHIDPKCGRCGKESVLLYENAEKDRLCWVCLAPSERGYAPQVNTALAYRNPDFKEPRPLNPRAS
jgi:hypothetical protein